MTRTLLIALFFLLPTALGAQRPIKPGGIGVGELREPGQKLPLDGSLIEWWAFDAEAGKTYEVRVRTSRFNAYVTTGPVSTDGICRPDADACAVASDTAGGTGAIATYVSPGSGPVYILVNTRRPGESGVYAIAVNEMASAAASKPKGAASSSGTITLDKTVAGELAETDTKLTDGSFYDTFLFEGEAGKEYEITLRSPGFDAFLIIGAGSGAEFRELYRDDDSGGGTDARLRYLFTSAFPLVIHVNSISAGETGPYTLTVTRTASVSARSDGLARVGRPRLD
jgi:hypothetical protein